MLILLLASPVSSFAFRNQAETPDETFQFIDSVAADRQTPASFDADMTDRADNDISGNEAAGIMVAGEISSASAASAQLCAASGFDAFNSRDKNQWQATFNADTGAVKRLYGSQSKPYAGKPEAAARAFLQDAHAMFGLPQDLSALKTQNISTTPGRSHVRFQQTYKGTAIEGAQIIVHSDSQGRVTMVQNESVEAIEPANQDVLTLEFARDIARDDLRQQLGSDPSMSASTVEKIIAIYSEEYRYIWKVSTPVQNPFGLWVYHIDAGSGEILYKADEIFYLKNGKGRAYLTNANWHAGTVSSASLKYMYTPLEGNPGYPLGLHVFVIDNNGNYAIEPSLQFNYEPAGVQKPWFDQAHAYYQKTTVWEWWKKNIISKYGPSNIAYFHTLIIPTYVNVTGMCNAFYSPNINGSSPGFAYGNESSCKPGSEDLVIDNDVVRHEYTHAIMHWAGFNNQFGGAVDGYGRAMGEGNADWYAFLFSGDPKIADVAFNHQIPAYLRNLDNTRMYPYDVNHPGTGMPQEHYTGEIWGGYLYDLARVMKKKAIPYVYRSSFYFTTSGGHRNGYPDFYDGIRAQMEAEKDMGKGLKQTMAAFGSMASRGLNRPLLPMYAHASNYFLTGSAGSDTRAYIYLLAPFKLKTQGNLLQSGDPHDYPFEANAGTVLSVKVSAKTGGMTNPTLMLYTIGGTLLQTVSTGAGITSAAMTFALPSTGRYVVRITGINSGAARGYYSLQMSTK